MSILLIVNEGRASTMGLKQISTMNMLIRLLFFQDIGPLRNFSTDLPHGRNLYTIPKIDLGIGLNIGSYNTGLYLPLITIPGGTYEINKQ